MICLLSQEICLAVSAEIGPRCVMAGRVRALDSSSCASNQPSVGLSPSHWESTVGTRTLTLTTHDLQSGPLDISAKKLHLFTSDHGGKISNNIFPPCSDTLNKIQIFPSKD